MGELFGKDYILDAQELRTWIRILEDPIHYGHAEKAPSGCALTEEPFGREPRSVVIMPSELPQGHEVLKENFAAPQPPEMSCAQQIPTLISTVRELVNVLSTNPSAAPSATREGVASGGLEPLKKKRISSAPACSVGIAPRLIRLRDAPRYLGMDPNRFNAEVRPYLTEMRIGKQGVAFDRIDLDTWADQYKSCNGRLGKVAKKGGATWAQKPHQGSSNVVKSGTSRRKSAVAEFEKALERATSQKRKGT
jgi:hypothetical protein